MMMLVSIQDSHLICYLWITQTDVHHETVQLGLWQRKRPLIFNGVLRRHDHKRLWQGIGDAIDGDLSFFHRLQQRRLRFGCGTIHLIRKHDLSHNWPRAKLTIACLLIINGGTSDVTRQEVRGELDTFKATSNRTSDSFGEDSFSNARNVFDQDMAVANNRDEA